MDRDGTVELFLKGREAWNAWAEALLAERKAMEAAGTWKSRRRYFSEREQGENPETQAWLDKAFADFSRRYFFAPGARSTRETAEESPSGGPDSCLRADTIHLEAERIDFSSFIFPGDAWFESTAFSGLRILRTITATNLPLALG